VIPAAFLAGSLLGSLVGFGLAVLAVQRIDRPTPERLARVREISPNVVPWEYDGEATGI